MASVNKVILIGNLGADPELRYTQGGKAVGELRVATTFKKGETEETEWHRVVLWEKDAENAAAYLTKGKSVYVEGRIKTRSYDDKDGVKKYITEIVAERLQFLSPKSAVDVDSEPAPESGKKTRGKRNQAKAETAAADDPFGE